MPNVLIRHHIFDQLRDDIMSCALPPGAELREGKLARQYGVSKSPVRDALQKLEFEGLVQIVPRQGHRVMQISINDARDILDLRETLEQAAVKKGAAEASEQDLINLNRFRIADMTTMRAFAIYNRSFHAEICRLCGNARQAGIMLGLMDNYERLCIVSLSSRNQEAKAMSAALNDHITIIDALQARDGRRAARLSAKHIHKSQSQVMRGLNSHSVVG
jgi:DNA-binding GntR family transcriptional regulator